MTKHEELRRKLYIDVATAVSSCTNCHYASTAVDWAGKVLEEFDRKFEETDKNEDNDL